VVLHFLVQVVLTERYLFAVGKVWFKTKSKKSVKDVTYRNVAYIDQHLFPNVVNIRVWTKQMRLYEGAVRNLPKLEKVRLKECAIRRIPPGTFMNLPVLRVVHMQDNDVTKIENGVFNYLPIEVLWLQRNAIEVIESEAFDNMPNLHTIKLNENQLMEWDNKWFSNTPKLTHLFFSKNQISELPARAFANIQTSHKINGTELVDTSIYLAMNEITEIHPEAFHGIDSLYRLRLRKKQHQKHEHNVGIELGKKSTAVSTLRDCLARQQSQCDWKQKIQV
jgi:Leucine-rich repeat (LRR) protein